MPKVLLNSTAAPPPSPVADVITLGIVDVASPVLPGGGTHVVDVITLGNTTALYDLYEPTPPQVSVTTSLPVGWDGAANETPSNSAQLTTAIANAVTADQSGGIFIIELTAGTTYTGQWSIEDLTGTDWIVFRSSAWNTTLPSVGTRVTNNTGMATMTMTNNQTCMRLGRGAHNVAFVGVEFSAATAAVLYEYFVIVGMSSGLALPTQASEVAYDVGFDRCYFNASTDSITIINGLVTFCDRLFITNSRFENIKAAQESHGLLCYGGGGIHLENNYIEAAGINLLFGGRDIYAEEAIARDMTITRNYISKRNEWNPYHVSYDSSTWSVKNHFECKMAKRVSFTANVLENTWRAGQRQSIVLTVRNQSGTNNWAVVEDVLIKDCLVKRVARFCNILPSDNLQTSAQCKRFKFENCLAWTVGGIDTQSDTEEFSDTGVFIDAGGPDMADGMLYFTVNHCTFMFQEGHLGQGLCRSGNETEFNNFKLTNNIWNDGSASAQQWYNDRGVLFLNTIEGGNGIYFPAEDTDVSARITSFATDYATQNYGTDNVKADSKALALFTDAANNDYTLQGGSPFTGAAADGADCGVNHTQLNAAISGVE